MTCKNNPKYLPRYTQKKDAKNTSYKGKVQKKEGKKLTSVSFMYVCVAGNGEMLVFPSPCFPNNS